MQRTYLIPFALLIAAFVVIPYRIGAQPPPPASGAPMPGPPDLAIDAGTKKTVIDSLLEKLKGRYVFADVAAKMEADIRSRENKKEYEAITSSNAFAKKLTEDLQTVSRDKHLRVRFAFGQGDPQKLTEAERNEMFRRQMQRINYGFNKVERLDGNIGLIDLRGFTDEVGGADTVAAAMTFLANTEALIFDLRQNGGGNPAMIALISSYLFGEKPVHLNDLYWREGNRTDEFWTKPEKAARKFPDKDIYVLTSNYTFSGAEEFSNNLKALKRATIIGETTGGGANPGGVVRLTENFSVFIPTGRAVNPITKTNWEGVGVQPDIKVPKEQALKTAHILALTKVMEREQNGDSKVVLQDMIERTKRELAAMKPTVEK